MFVSFLFRIKLENEMKFISILFMYGKLNLLVLVEIRYKFHSLKFIEITHWILEEAEHV